MKTIIAIIAAIMLTAGLARAAGEQTWLEEQLKAWREGKAPHEFHLPDGGKQIVDYEIINVVYTQLGGAQTALFNCMIAVPGGGKGKPMRAVIRVGPDAKKRAEYAVGIGWRRYDAPAHDPRPTGQPAAATPLTSPQQEAASKAIMLLRVGKTDPKASHDQLVAMGLAALPMLQKDLHTYDMRVRREFCRIVDELNPPDEAKIFADELTFAIGSFTKLVSSIRDNAAQAADYRARAAKLPDVTGAGNVGGLKTPGEKTDKQSYLRLAAKLDDKVADDKRDLDACAEVVEMLCNYFASTGVDADLALFTTLACDKSALTRVPGWSFAVIGDEEYTQLPPVGFSVHRDVNVGMQEQDWLPWGPVWGTLRTLIESHGGRQSLIDCRDAMEKTFVPLEKKKGGAWQQSAAVTEFERTEALWIDRLSSDHGASAPPAPVECAGPARARLLASVYDPPAASKTEDEWDKRRRLGHEAEAKRSAETTTWHITFKFAPGPPPAALDKTQVVGEPCFMAGDFDNFKEVLPVTAFLGMRQGAPGTIDRIILGSFEIPLKAAVALDIENGKRTVGLELWCRVKLGDRTRGTLGGVTTITAPVEVQRMLLHDDATGQVIFDKSEPVAKEKPAAKEAPKDGAAPATDGGPKGDDKDVIKEAE